MESTILDGRPAGRTDERTEKLGIEPATAKLELGLGLSLAKAQNGESFNKFNKENYFAQKKNPNTRKITTKQGKFREVTKFN